MIWLGRFGFAVAMLIAWGNYSDLATQHYTLEDTVRFTIHGLAITVVILVGWVATEVASLRLLVKNAKLERTQDEAWAARMAAATASQKSGPE